MNDFNVIIRDLTIRALPRTTLVIVTIMATKPTNNGHVAQQFLIKLALFEHKPSMQ